MKKTKTTRYDVAEHLRTPKEMAAYLEACLEEADGDAAFIAKALGDITFNVLVAFAAGKAFKMAGVKAGFEEPIVVTGPRAGDLNFNGPVKFRNADGSIDLDVATRRYAGLVDSNKEWKWKTGFDVKFKKSEERLIRREAIARGLVPELPFKPGTRHPDFEAAGLMETYRFLPKNYWKMGDTAQNNWLNARLPNGKPEGYTWHHSEIAGRMELIPFGIHNITNHKGGRAPGGWAYRPR